MGASSFNSNISHWNISSVTDMNTMFYEATSFNQNLCPWGSKLPATFYSGTTTYGSNVVYFMFTNSSCPNKTSPTDSAGPWCAVTNCTA